MLKGTPKGIEKGGYPGLDCINLELKHELDHENLQCFLILVEGPTFPIEQESRPLVVFSLPAISLKLIFRMCLHLIVGPCTKVQFAIVPRFPRTQELSSATLAV